MNFKFLRESKLITTTYWSGDVEYTIQIPEDITDDYDIAYYLKGWTDAHNNFPKTGSDRWLDRRNYVVYEMGYYNYELTQQELRNEDN